MDWKSLFSPKEAIEKARQDRQKAEDAKMNQFDDPSERPTPAASPTPEKLSGIMQMLSNRPEEVAKVSEELPTLPEKSMWERLKEDFASRQAAQSKLHEDQMASIRENKGNLKGLLEDPRTQAAMDNTIDTYGSAMGSMGMVGKGFKSVGDAVAAAGAMKKAQQLGNLGIGTEKAVVPNLSKEIQPILSGEDYLNKIARLRAEKEAAKNITKKGIEELPKPAPMLSPEEALSQFDEISKKFGPNAKETDAARLAYQRAVRRARDIEAANKKIPE